MVENEDQGDFKCREEFRTNDEQHNYIIAVCSQRKIDKSTLMRYLLNLCAKYDLLNPDWIRELIEEELTVFRNKEEIRVNNETRIFDRQEDRRDAGKEKERSFQVGMKLLDTYLKAMPPEQRKQYIEDRIRQQHSASLDNPLALPVKDEKLEGYEVRINGRTIRVKALLPDGMPKLDFNQDRLVRCDNGFHTRGSWCSFCDRISFCSLVRDERFGVK